MTRDPHAPAMRGFLHSINISHGGVPKRPVVSCRVGAAGIEGDVQRQRRFHGGPDRALCLYSLDRIHALQAEGHAVAAGILGENLTLEGIDWDAVVPWTRIAVGDVLLEVTSFASPCRQVAGVFRDERFTRISHKMHPGWSRVYSRVLAGGQIERGASATLLA